MANSDPVSGTDDDGADQPAPAEVGGDERPDRDAEAAPPEVAEAAPEEPAADAPGDQTPPLAAVPPTVSPPSGPAPVVDAPPAVNIAAPPFVIMPPVAAPKTGWRSFGVLIGIGVALVLVLGTTLVFTLVGGGVSGAEDRVLSFYQNLSDKDGAGARKLLKGIDEDVFSEEDLDLDAFLSESPFWTSKALKRGYQPPTDVEVVHSVPTAPSGVERKKGREYALVTVAYSLGKQSATETFGLERAAEGDWTIITAALGGFGLPEEESFRLDIAGHDDADGSDGDVCPECGDCEDCGATFSLGSVLAPPGRYDVAITEHAVFEDLKSTIDVAPGLDGQTGADFSFSTFDFKIRDGVVATVESLVKDVIDECATGGYGYSGDAECPWSDTGDLFDAEDSWDVKSYPEFKIVADYAGEAVLETVKPGKATATDTWTDEEITAKLVVDGGLGEEDGEIVWYPDEY